MNGIGDRCAEYGYGGVANSRHIDFVKGANITRFNKVTDAMQPTASFSRFFQHV